MLGGLYSQLVNIFGNNVDILTENQLVDEIRETVLHEAIPL
ncbi:hypothetical protein [Pelistega ratti]|nr:hypothetical protein [Pelistega ratti]